MLPFRNHPLVNKDNTNENGFTLIELLVVILIIGILSAIAVPVFLNQRKVAVDSTVESDITNASLAVASWDVGNAGKVVPLPGDSSQLSKDIKLSSGNTVTIVGNSADYCITGTNPQGNKSVTGMVYSSLNGGLNKEGSCAGFVPTESPTINSTVSIAAPDVTTVVIPPVVAAENVATCGVMTLTSTAGTWITCIPITTTNDYQSFSIKIGNKSKTPIKWDVSGDIKSTKVIKMVDAWSGSVKEQHVTTKTFNVVGDDRSWNNNPVDPVNYAYTYDTRTQAFTIGITWK